MVLTRELLGDGTLYSTHSIRTHTSGLRFCQVVVGVSVEKDRWPAKAQSMLTTLTTTLSELNRLYGEYYEATSRSKDEAEKAWTAYVQYARRYKDERGMI